MSDRKRLLVNRDRLLHAPRKKVAQACAALFSTVQGLAKEVQILALAAAFTIICEATKLPPRDAHEAVNNLMYDPLTANGRALQFDAMRYHLDTELLPDDEAGL